MFLGRSSTLNAGEVSIAAPTHLGVMLGRGRWELVNESRGNWPDHEARSGLEHHASIAGRVDRRWHDGSGRTMIRRVECHISVPQ